MCDEYTPTTAPGLPASIRQKTVWDVGDDGVRLFSRLGVDEVVAAIKWPVCEWPGNCHAVSSRMCEVGLIHGFTRYGLWRGDIAEDSFFWPAGLARHGWAVQAGAIDPVDGDADLVVVDPTRWVFEDAEPYIYIGHQGREYDMGATAINGHDRTDNSPAFDNLAWEQERFTPDLWRLISGLLGDNCCYAGISKGQLFWLANRSPLLWGDQAAEFYTWIGIVGKQGLVPIDYLMEVQNTHGF